MSKRSSPKTLEDFLSLAVKEGDCLVWTRCVNTDGYPRCKWKSSFNGKVHRIVYELANPDQLIDGYVIRHTCDNIKCINPAHLLVGKPFDNNRDRDIRGRSGTAKLTPSQVIDIRSLYSNTPMLQKDIAESFGVNPRTVSGIVTGKNWKWVDEKEKDHLRD